MLDNSFPGEHSPINFQAIFESMPGNFLILQPHTPDYTILAISDELVSATGRERQDIMGKKLFEVFPDNPSATATGPSTLAISLQNALEYKKIDHMPEVRYDVTNAAGEFQERYWAASTKPVLNPQGEVLYLIHTTIEVTHQIAARQQIEKYAEELRESEQRFRLMADASPAMIWSLEPDASLKYANKFMLEFLGVTLEKLKAHNWLPYIHPEDLQRSIHTIGEALDKGQPFRNDHRFLRQDGQHRWLLSQAAPSYYPNGQLYGYVGSSVDITEIKQAEIALQRFTQELAGVNAELRSSNNQVQETNNQLSSSNHQLSRINADLDNFIYSASHDLKTPISNIEGLMQAILEDLPREVSQEPAMRELFQRVSASIERFKKTISDLAEITKLNREDASEKDSPVDLASVIKEVQLDLRGPIEQAQAKLEIDLGNCKSVPLSAKNVRSIIYNLISNSVKYRSFARPSFIQIRCYRQELYQVLSVQDNGLGMDLADESKVFGMFKRLHDHVEGSGVGLYMVKKIIEHAGGKIEVASQVDQGTTFRVYFPQNGV